MTKKCLLINEKSSSFYWDQNVYVILTNIMCVFLVAKWLVEGSKLFFVRALCGCIERLFKEYVFSGGKERFETFLTVTCNVHMNDMILSDKTAELVLFECQTVFLNILYKYIYQTMPSSSLLIFQVPY